MIKATVAALLLLTGVAYAEECVVPEPVPVLTAEAESAGLAEGWELSTNREGYTGEGYILNTAGNRLGQAGEDYTTFYFNVTVAGTYELQVRSRSIGGSDVTQNNDSWFRIESGTTPSGKIDMGDWVKVYQSAGDKWTTQTVAHLGSQHTKVQRNLGIGTVAVDLTGRSQGHAIDSLSLVPVNFTVVPPVATDGLPVGSLYQPGDLISLHYDYAPDPDDGHASIAGRMVVDYFNLGGDVMAVHATYSDKTRNMYDKLGLPVMEAAWGTLGGLWYNNHNSPVSTRNEAASQWGRTLDAGNKVWVAEGGPASFSAGVLRQLEGTGQSNLKNVFIVQHSHGTGFNEKQTDEGDIAHIKDVANYVTIPNGNRGGNGSADLNHKDAEVVRKFLAGSYGYEWSKGFEYLDPSTNKFDGSDTVELLYILNVPVEEVRNWGSFEAKFN